ncbi:hypothetical protein DPMN_187202 [Dreissena polymorpha]|uniref:Uncharacterized protein n=1 Tax=Dreissena polymorpha TaxID=45954 RepID=A0A9D4DPP9_DREPO|nr:hypothetical protein DPMN_187202 [Dreissena polymorpha]
MPLCVSRIAHAQNGGRLYFCRHCGNRDRRGRLFEHVLQEHIPPATELPGRLTQMTDADVGVSATIAPGDPVQMAWDAACAGSAEKYDGPAFIATRCEAVTPPPAPSTPVQDESVMPTEMDQADPLFQGQEAETSEAGELRSFRELLGHAVGHLATIADRSAQILEETLHEPRNAGCNKTDEKALMWNVKMTHS